MNKGEETEDPAYDTRVTQDRTAIGRVLIACALLAVAALVLDTCGRLSRKYSDGHVVRRIERPWDAFSVWRDSGVQGRTLFYFDRRFRIEPIAQESIEHAFAAKGPVPDLTERNFLFLAMNTRMLRAVYHVVPEKYWQEVKEKLFRYSHVLYDGRSFRLTEDGVPIIVTTSRALPVSGEPALVFLNTAYRDDYDDAVQAFLDDTKRTDIVLLWNGTRED
ncbi:MAG: hypothetical protein OHK006_06390 [Thermodesulfovibrionales bacterium]